MVCECVFNMVKRYILTRLMSRRGTQRESWRALEEHSNLFTTSSPISYITRPFMFRPPVLLLDCGHLIETWLLASSPIYIVSQSLGINMHLKIRLALQILIGFHVPI